MKTRNFTLIGAFLLFIACSSAIAQSLSGPYAEEYIDQIGEVRKTMTWAFERPTPPAIDTVDMWLKWKTVQNFSFGKDRGSLDMIADLEALHPFFRDKIIELINQCDKKGIKLAVVETYRTHAKQNEYKSMGRKYTRSGGGHSKHQYGLAVDVVPIVDSTAVWNNHALWKKIGTVGERLGLRWGGRWRHPYDPGHFEWTGGLSSYHLAQGTFPAIPRKENYPCVDEDLARLRKYWAEWETEQAALARKPKSKTAMK